MSQFTFQYGQIYYPEIGNSLSIVKASLHSNMVRFIMRKSFLFIIIAKRFTFQYGQIYYSCKSFNMLFSLVVYIPIWLDLLFKKNKYKCKKEKPFTFQYGQIYYGTISQQAYRILFCLHSNMVRFIICIRMKQYENGKKSLHSNMVRFIIHNTCLKLSFKVCVYIPIWLDLLYGSMEDEEIFNYRLHSNMVRFII